MGRLSAVVIAFALGAASAMALVACGSGGDADLLPGTAAGEIESKLDEVARLADEGDCVGAELAVADVVADVEELREVDLRLKAALQEGTAKLSEAVSRCEEEGAEEPEPTTESAVEAEEVEGEKKAKKEKPGKEDEEQQPQEEPGEGEGQEPPPQSEGKGEEKGGGAPSEEPEGEETAPAGGVGPSVGVE